MDESRVALCLRTTHSGVLCGRTESLLLPCVLTKYSLVDLPPLGSARIPLQSLLLRGDSHKSVSVDVVL